MPNSVTPNMPANTAVPSECRISAPAPVAMTSGKTPKMNANEVIRMGRRRSRDASTVASKRGLPSWCNCLANSTMRMAFLHANPTSTTRPICTKMSTDKCANSTPATEHKRQRGTTRTTAKRSVQLSYSGQGAQRHHQPLVVADVQQVDVIDPRAELALGLERHLPVAAELVVAGDVQGAQVDRQRLVQVVERHPQRRDLVAVDVQVK